MKKTLFSLLLVYSVLLFSQNKLSGINHVQPIILMDGVVTTSDMNALDGFLIKSVNVYKSKEFAKQFAAFDHYIEYGLLDIEMKKPQMHLTKISLNTLNKMNGLDAENPVYINGILIKDNKVEVFENAISELKIIDLENQKILNINLKGNESNNFRLPQQNMDNTLIKKDRPVYLKQIK